ncbi:MAG: methyltransferase domain-containing protein [Burkholderiaceae bacterium]
MSQNPSVRFFDEQFQRQIAENRHELNPFEMAALPWVRGKVLEYGCGMGNLAVAVARNGCEVLALDASPAAIAHLGGLAASERLPITAQQADLRTHRITGVFDTVICIGLLMFFNCPTAYRKLAQLQSQLAPGGVAIVNVLTRGTTYLDMFSADGYCLLEQQDLLQRFAGWEILGLERASFPAPGNTQKVFITITARKPSVPLAAG